MLQNILKINSHKSFLKDCRIAFIFLDMSWYVKQPYILIIWHVVYDVMSQELRNMK